MKFHIETYILTSKSVNLTEIQYLFAQQTDKNAYSAGCGESVANYGIMGSNWTT